MQLDDPDNVDYTAIGEETGHRVAVRFQFEVEGKEDETEYCPVSEDDIAWCWWNFCVEEGILQKTLIGFEDESCEFVRWRPGMHVERDENGEWEFVW